MELELVEEKSNVCKTTDTSGYGITGSPLIGIVALMGVVIVIAVGIKYLKDNHDAKNIQNVISPQIGTTQGV